MSGFQKTHPIFYLLSALAALLLVSMIYADRRVDASTARLLSMSRPDRAAATGDRFSGAVVARAESGVAHSPTLIEHADGSLQAIWFQGTTEAGRDVSLWSARRSDRNWSPPAKLFDASDESRALGYRVKTLGNPALFHGADGTVWLAYVNPSIGGWATSRIALRRSNDDGKTWSVPRQLVTSPLLGMSTLVRFGAVPAQQGLMALPAYHELLQDYPFLLLLDAEGQIVGSRRIGSGAGSGIQPLIFEPEAGRFAAATRPMGSMQRRIHLSRSLDGGVMWSDARPTSLESASSPACGLTRANGDSLLSYNPDAEVRDRLAFIHIDGETGEWRRLDHDISPRTGRGKVSYCTMIERRDGSIAMVFTDTSRRLIRAVDFTPGWLERKVRMAKKIEP